MYLKKNLNPQLLKNENEIVMNQKLFLDACISWFAGILFLLLTSVVHILQSIYFHTVT